MIEWVHQSLTTLFDPKRTEVVRMPFAEYLAAPGVSKSLLSALDDCPLTAREMIQVGPPAPTEAMIIGSAVDILLTDQNRFDQDFVVRPETRPDDPDKEWNGNAKACRAWLLEHSDKRILSPKQKDEVDRIVSVVMSDQRARELIDQCEPQLSVFWRDPKTGLQMKTRPDLTGDRFAIELKVTADARTDAFSRQIDSLGYHRQAAIQMDGLNANGRDCCDFLFIAVQRGERPKCNVRRLKQAAIDLGRIEYQHQLRRLKDCLDRNSWPDYSGEGEIGYIDLPAYAYQRGEEVELNIGGKVVAI